MKVQFNIIESERRRDAQSGKEIDELRLGKWFEESSQMFERRKFGIADGLLQLPLLQILHLGEGLWSVVGAEEIAKP